MYRPQSYSLQNFGEMIANLPRMQAYHAALQLCVHPGNTLVDIGCGSGIFSLLACQLGAGHVYAIEPGDAILVAQEIARENGFADRITFIQEVSSAIDLPEKADVIVSDLRSVLPLFQQHIPSIIDGRRRFLKDGGVLIPRRDVLCAAVVENAAQYQRFMSSWIDSPYSLKMQATHQYLTNTWEKANLTSGQLLSQPQTWASLDYHTIDTPDVRADLSIATYRAGIAHGLAIWFDADLADDAGFSNAPGAPPLIYGQAFFPFPRPLPVKAGDAFHVHLRADLTGGDYIWTWKTRCIPAGQPDSTGWDFEQSTLYSTPVSLSRLKKAVSNYTPTLSDDGQVDRFILDRMDGSASLAEIAQAAAETFPARFPTWKEALARAAGLSQKYSR